MFWDQVPRGADPELVVQAMTDALAHRGPDGAGVRRVTQPADDTVGVFGHRRLAIIDLSERGAQPMIGPTGAVLTFNGEVYNFKALRHDLESLGCRFRSDSDTEVVLQGYEQWGPRVVDRLQGMFAFAIWDTARRTLLLARDRLGIKPLYVCRTAGALLFASEIRSILASGLIDRRLDLAALDQYLAYQTVPSPRTLVAGVGTLGPGEYAIAAAGGAWSVTHYWDLLSSADADAGRINDAVEARTRVRALLGESIGLHLVSDVSVGVFLSGGIDSSALVGLVRDAGVVPRTFTVACPGTRFDESRHARDVAEEFASNHTEILLSEGELLDQLPEAMAGVDHPSGDGINTWVVSRAVRQAGVKVALSGLGGDEFFGGYPSFRRLERLSSLAPVLRHSPARARRAAAAAVRALGGATVSSAKTAALLESDGSLPQAFLLLRQMFSHAQRRSLLEPEALRAVVSDPYLSLLDAAAGRVADGDTMRFVSYAEARTYMHDLLLRDTDQMSMRHGLEVRVPLLDHRLVEYVMALPAAVKQAGERAKPLLVDSLPVSLPAAAVRPKQGFVLPFEQWMKTALRPFCERYLGHGGLLRLGAFDRQATEALWSEFLGGGGAVTWSRPWTLVALGAWAARNGISR